MLARHVASSRLDQPWSSLTFKKSERGRPYLAQRQGAPLLDLNTSHDGNLVAVASLLSPTASPASPSQPPPRVGVDVMRIRNPWEGTSVSEFISGIAEQLAPRERSALSRLGEGAGTGSDAQRLRHALALWTLKEAFVKATGEGLHRDLLEVEFELEFSGRSGEDGGEGEMLGEGRLEGRRMDGWRFWIVDVDGGELESARTAYWLAVAEQTSDGTGEVRRLRREPEWVAAVELAEIEARARGAS